MPKHAQSASALSKKEDSAAISNLDVDAEVNSGSEGGSSDEEESTGSIISEPEEEISQGKIMMSGDFSSARLPESSGIIPRFLHELFNKLSDEAMAEIQANAS